MKDKAGYELKDGDLIAITERHKGHGGFQGQFQDVDYEECFLAVVRGPRIDRQGYTSFAYIPHGIFFGKCAHGVTGTDFGKYGTIDIKVLKNIRSAKSSYQWYPQPGNTGYDLMC